MKKTYLKKSITFILVIALVCTGINLNAIRTWIINEYNNIAITEVEAKNNKKQKENTEPTIVKELEGLRTKNTTTYLLSNGLERLQIYGTDIRYEEDGKLIDYDPAIVKIDETQKKKLKNILKKSKIADEVNIEDYEYTNAASDTKIYFPKQFDKNAGILLENNKRTIAFSPVLDNVGEKYKEIQTETTQEEKTVEKEEKTTISGTKDKTDEETESLKQKEETAEEESETAKKEVATAQTNTSNNETKTTTENSTEKIKDVTFGVEKDSIKGNRITYANEDCDYEYQYVSDIHSIKEEIVLNKKPSKTTFEFYLKLPGMVLKQRKDEKSIQILDKDTEKIIAYIDEPNLKTNDGKIKYDEVRYEIEKQEDEEYLLKVVVDEAFLQAETTKYPVTIDPSMMFWYGTDVESATVNDMIYSSGINMKNTTYMQVQNQCNDYGPYIGTQQFCYIDIQQLVEDYFFGYGDEYIQNVMLCLKEYSSNGSGRPNGTQQVFTPGTVEVRGITDTWDPNTITWDNHPDMGDTVWAEFECSGTYLAEHNIDITSWAHAVIDKREPNCGIALKAKEINTGDTFYSSQFHYEYFPSGGQMFTSACIGIDYLDIGRYFGVSGVYSPTGNFSESTEDMSVQTVLGDISLARTYNSLQTDDTSIVGRGFSFNYAMRVMGGEMAPKVVMPDGNVWRFLWMDPYISLNNSGKIRLENGKFKLTTLDQIEYGFNEDGYLEYVKDERNNQIDIETDTDGKILSITDVSGTDVRFTYTSGHLTKIEEMKNNVAIETVKYTYSNNHLTKAEYHSGLESHYQYENEKLIKETLKNADGTEEQDVVELTYCSDGANGRKVHTTKNAIGVIAEYSYDILSATISESTVNHEDIRRIRETFNVKRALTKTEDLLNSEENQVVCEISYEDNEDDDDEEEEINEEIFNPEKISSAKDQYRNTTTYQYDSNDNVIKAIYPDRSEENWVYDLNTNDMLRYTDRNGLVTENTYANNLLVRTTTGGIETNCYTYYPASQYGIAGLIHTETDAHGNVTTYTYDSKGNVLTTAQMIDGVNRITTNTYDDQGNLILEVDPNGVRTEYTYDISGNVVLQTVRNAENTVIKNTRTVHDSFGRVIQEIEPLDYNAANDHLPVDSYSNHNVGTRTTYNEAGQVISETDRKGNTTSYVYDDDGNVKKEISPNGSYTEYTYDNEGRVEEEYFYDSVTDQRKLLKWYIYDEGQNKKTTVEYYDNNRFDSYIEEYNWEDNLIRKRHSNYLIENYIYNHGLLVEERRGTATLKKYTYDTFGRVIKEQRASGGTEMGETLYEYDNYGNVIKEKVKNNLGGYETTYAETRKEYDSRNQLIKTIIYDRNNVSEYNQNYYSWDGNLLREYTGLTSPITINGLDDVTDTENQDYFVMKYSYDSMGRLIGKTDAMNQTETYQYDKEDQEILKVDRNGVNHTTQYDKNGNVTREVHGNIVKEYTYDCMDNVLTEKEGSVQTNYTYDGEGNCLSEITGSIKKYYTYNYAGWETEHIIKIGNQQKQKVSKTYDKRGNLTAVYEDDVLKASYQYNIYDELTKTVNANGITERNSYNAAGLITETVNMKGNDIISRYRYNYYCDGKEYSKEDLEGKTIYEYDDNGQLVRELRKENDNSGNNNTTFNNAKPISVDTYVPVKIDTAGQKRYYSFIPGTTGQYTITSSNNTDDPDLSLYSANGTFIGYEYDGNGGNNFKMVETLTAGTKYVLEVEEYFGTGECQLLIKQNLENENTSSSNAKMVIEDTLIPVNIADDDQIKYYSFVPETTGVYQIESFCCDNNPIAYLYRGDGTFVTIDSNSGEGNNFKITQELTVETPYVLFVRDFEETGNFRFKITPPLSDSRTITEYTYDINGNRTVLKETKNSGITETNYTYDKNDRLLTKQTGNQTTVSYTYDNNGNMTSSSEGVTQIFDDLNRMTSYSKGNTTTTYKYYPNDMRSSKKVGNQTMITQVWCGDDIELELKGSQETRKYLYGEKLIYGTYGWYVYNAHGDVTALADNTGNITKNYDYDSFGVEKNANANDNNPYRYCGEYYDSESGYTYLQARYYDSEIGRFVSEDPALDGNNWYVYCGNDPINMIDPTGMWTGTIHRELTEYAFNKIKKRIAKKDRKNALKKLKDACTTPDKLSSYKKGYWHGHDTDKKTVDDVTAEMAKKYKTNRKKKVGKAFKMLGLALHTIQDYYAHNVMQNGSYVNSRIVASGCICYAPSGNGYVISSKGTAPDNITDDFINKCNEEGFLKEVPRSKVTNWVEGNKYYSVHHATADNPYADFDGQYWVWKSKKTSNTRYMNARKESVKYLKKYVKKIPKSKKNKKK